MVFLPLRLGVFALILILAGPVFPSSVPQIETTEQTTARRPNVVVFLVDDLSKADQDRIETPVIDGLAARGASFRRAYAMPTCSPTRFTILFGRYRSFDSGRVCAEPQAITPSPDQYSLPRLFKDNGYSTGVFGKWHLGASTEGPWEAAALKHGFDVWRAGVAMNLVDCGSEQYWYWSRIDDGESSMSTEYCTTAIQDAFLEWWAETEGPKFAFVPFTIPHGPLHLPPRAALPKGYPRRVTSNENKFDAMVASLDFTIGRMMRAIDLEDTWVFYLADNGSAAGTRTFAPKRRGKGRTSIFDWGLKGTTFERGVNVPLIVAGPGLEEAIESEALVHTVDMMGTLAELLGLALPESADLDSVSFVPALTDANVSPRSHVYSELLNEKYRDQAVIERRFKLIRRTRGPKGKAKLLDHPGTEALFDLLHDPLERNPLDLMDDAHGEVLKRLRSIMNGPRITRGVEVLREGS